jgi:hypothetical protein
MHGLDPFLLRAIVADRAPRGLDAAGQRRVGHDAAVPDGLDQLVLGDQASGMARQIRQQFEHLRFDRQQGSAAPQFEGGEIQLHIPKAQTGRHSHFPLTKACP